MVPLGGGRVGECPDLHAAFKEFADQALVGDAALGSFGFEGGQQGFGEAHVDAGGLGGGFPGQGAQLGEIEGGEAWARKASGDYVGCAFIAYLLAEASGAR